MMGKMLSVVTCAPPAGDVLRHEAGPRWMTSCQAFSGPLATCLCDGSPGQVNHFHGLDLGTWVDDVENVVRGIGEHVKMLSVMRDVDGALFVQPDLEVLQGVGNLLL